MPRKRTPPELTDRFRATLEAAARSLKIAYDAYEPTRKAEAFQTLCRRVLGRELIGDEDLSWFLAHSFGWTPEYAATVADRRVMHFVEAELQQTERDRARNAETVRQLADDQEEIQYVTLQDMADIVHKSKRCLESHKNKHPDPLPTPDHQGGGGKPHQWVYSRVRPWLERNFRPDLPRRFPSPLPPPTAT
jgi:hypothetical protein